MTAYPRPADALAGGAFTALARLDRQIAAVPDRIRRADPRLPLLVAQHWADIDQLLDLRIWLSAGAEARRGRRAAERP
jgi:hypothetical protein